MFDQDELGNSGWDISAKALENGGAGGTMALNIASNWDQAGGATWMRKIFGDLQRARDEQGWDIHAVAQFEDLLEFARLFSQRHYV